MSEEFWYRILAEYWLGAGLIIALYYICKWAFREKGK